MLELELAFALELVFEAEAGCWLGGESIGADRPAACLAAAVGAIFEALRRVLHLRELAFDLLAKGKVALSDERLRPQISWMLVDGGQ